MSDCGFTYIKINNDLVNYVVLDNDFIKNPKAAMEKASTSIGVEFYPEIIEDENDMPKIITFQIGDYDVICTLYMAGSYNSSGEYDVKMLRQRR